MSVTFEFRVLNSVPTSCLPLALSWPRVLLVLAAPVPTVPPWLQYKIVNIVVVENTNLKRVQRVQQFVELESQIPRNIPKRWNN